jgi:dTMP kinase
MIQKEGSKMITEKRGLFIVFEGIDGSGTSTQVLELMKKIEDLDKYQDVIRTHEPWKNKRIKEILEQDKDVYSNAEELAHLYIGDRTDHSYTLILPNLLARAIILCSRYKISTCAFQWAQGMPLIKLLQMHEHRGILVPDVTFFLDVNREVAAQRMKERASQEKFERNAEFIDRVITNYRKLTEISEKYPQLFGRIIRIDANANLNEVTKEVFERFLPIYQEWKEKDKDNKFCLQKSAVPFNEILREVSEKYS